MAEPLKDDPTLARRDAEAALRASEARYRRLFETAKDGILVLDAHAGLITDVKPFLSTLLDYSWEDFLGKTLWDIGAFKQIQESKAAFRELQNEQYIRHENLPLETRSTPTVRRSRLGPTVFLLRFSFALVDTAGPSSFPVNFPRTSASTSFASRCTGPRAFVRFKVGSLRCEDLLCFFKVDLLSRFDCTLECVDHR